MAEYTELIKALRCCGSTSTDCTVCPWDKYNFGMCAEKLLMDAADAIEALQAAQPHWVSVFDDLPRHNAVVVVSDGKRSWDIGQYHFSFKADDSTIWWWKKHTTRKVLWWMYKEDAIPEPPKEDA